MRGFACLVLVGHLLWLAVDTLFGDPRSFPTLSAVTFPLTFLAAGAIFYGSALRPTPSARRRRAYRD